MAELRLLAVTSWPLCTDAETLLQIFQGFQSSLSIILSPVPDRWSLCVGEHTEMRRSHAYAENAVGLFWQAAGGRACVRRGGRGAQLAISRDNMSP